jgi:hypothetical protein
MFTLFDLMRAAQGGAAMENMAQRFGISLDQTRRATEALMPAFALGFQRNAGDPMGFSNLLRMMGSGQYAGFFEQPGQAFSPRALSEGNTILAQLFGPEVSRQVAEQTAAWAGIAPEIMRQMMPAVATMLMGGLFHSAAHEGLADMFEQCAKVLRGGAPAPDSRQASDRQALPDPFSAWTGMLAAMWGGAPSGKEEPRPERPRPNDTPDPFAPWTAMMTAMTGGGQPAAPSAPEPPPAPEPAPLQAPLEFFNNMFDIGREVQAQQLATLQTIFDAYWGGNAKRP